MVDPVGAPGALGTDTIVNLTPLAFAPLFVWTRR